MAAEHTDTPPKPNASQREVEKAEKMLKETVRRTHDVLLSVSTIVPFTIFPDTITIDREKVTLVQRFFFNAATVRSIKLEDVLDVTATAGPFFGSVHLISRGVNPEEGFSVKFLKREDAFRVKRIMNGFIVLVGKEDINLDVIDTDELVAMLERAGRNEAPDISRM